jgi:predicted transposase/invertase (TIGR01784 family)
MGMAGSALDRKRTTLDPKLDVVFNFLFSAEANRRLLIALLGAVLEPATPIISVDLLPQRPDVVDAEEKLVLLDLRIRLASGEFVDVEMQTRRHAALRERVLFYWGRLYTGQLQRGDAYPGLQRCVVVLIADFIEFPDPEFHSIFQVSNRKTGRQFSDKLALHLLELPKLRSALPRDDEPELAAWCRFLSAETDDQLEALAMQHPIINEAKHALDLLSADPDVRDLAVKRELELQLREHERQLHQQEMVVARREGLEEGATRKARLYLTKVLKLKFGELPPEVPARIQAASEPELDRWLEQTITAETLDSVFR